MITVNGILVCPTIFPDGTSQVWKLSEEAMSGSSPSIEWSFDSEAEVFQVAQLIHLLSFMGKKPTLHVPFLPYGRQDKDVGNSSTFALRTLCLVLMSAGLEEITTVDAHSDVLATWGSACGMSVKNISPVNRIVDVIKDFHATRLCFPDNGALLRYGDLLDSSPSVVLDKCRDEATGEILGLRVLAGQVVSGDRVLIVDDLCDGGRTFIEAAKLLHEQYEGLTIGLYVSHGIFSKGTGVLFDAGISHIFTKDGEV